ncbi:hypothetical protein BKA62DRAFT_760939 [Auriculariales sp. MPI-PUGE-AT-0066]|nr:hypothetical protein BKA62DRAFT_760939 [Auriculariales sp. MPI-PUGE-AT-0066]
MTTATVTPFAHLLAEGLHDLQVTKWMCTAIVGHRLMALYADNIRVKFLIFVVWFAAVVALTIINIIILPKHGAKASGLPFALVGLAQPILIQIRRAATRMHTTAGASVRYDSMAIASRKTHKSYHRFWSYLHTRRYLAMALPGSLNLRALAPPARRYKQPVDHSAFFVMRIHTLFSGSFVHRMQPHDRRRSELKCNAGSVSSVILRSWQRRVSLHALQITVWH